MTYNNLDLIYFNNWEELWTKYNTLYCCFDRIVEAVIQISEAIKEVFNKAFNSLKEIFRDFSKCLTDFKQEEVSYYICKCPWRQYKYQPQLKVNTKGYSPCFLPVTRRYI